MPRAFTRPAGSRSCGRAVEPDDYRLAVRRLEAACQVVVDDPERLAEYRRALALAFYRAGQPAQAMETIHGSPAKPAPTHLDQTRVMPVSSVSTLDLAVTAMASQKLGDSPRAREALDQLRELVQSDQRANDQEAQVLFREAEGVVGTSP